MSGARAHLETSHAAPTEIFVQPHFVLLETQVLAQAVTEHDQRATRSLDVAHAFHLLGEMLHSQRTVVDGW